MAPTGPFILHKLGLVWSLPFLVALTVTSVVIMVCFFSLICLSFIHINLSTAVFPTARDQLLGRVHHPVQHVEPDVHVFPPKHVPNLPMVQEGPILSPNKQDHLYTLAGGGGIDEFDANGLLEKCDGCRRVFIPTVLRLHIIGGCGE